MSTPDSLRVEVNFDGTWTDVSGWLKAEDGGSTRYGRTSPFSTAQSASLSLVLDNRDGRFTPESAVYWPNGRDQAAVAHPYYPNVTVRRPIRFGPVVAGTFYSRFNGLVQGWPPGLGDNDSPTVRVDASDLLSVLSRVLLRTSIVTEVLADSPLGFWPLTDGAGSDTASEATGSGFPDLTVVSNGTALAFGDSSSPVGAELTSVKFAPTSQSDGQSLAGTVVGAPKVLSLAVEAWIRSDSAAWSQTAVEVELSEGTVTLGLDGSGHANATYPDNSNPPSPTSLTGSANIADGSWHHLFLDLEQDPRLYVDGADAAGVGAVHYPDFTPHTVRIGGTGDGLGVVGNISHVAVYGSSAADPIDDTRIPVHYQAGRGFKDETVDQRITRLLGYVGIPFGTSYGSGPYGVGPYGGGTGINIDPSTVVLNGYQQGGKDVVTAIQDAAASEGGGAVFYQTVDGTLRFTNRDYRSPTDPTLTVEAGADDDAASFQPAYDDRTIVNRCDAVRATAATTTTVGTATDDDSIDTYGTAGESVTSYAQDRDDVLRLAQDVVASQAQPGYRLQQVTVDLLTAQNDLWADVAATSIGDRIRATDLPPTSAPTATVDSLAEGWADQFNAEGYTVTFDTSPADNPARGVWDDDTYGRWAGDGNTLTATITAAATSLQVDTAADLPLFTSDSADYPLDIRIDEEDMTVTAAPGSTSPQTMSVTRGVNGTVAAAHAAGATVDVAVVPTWTL